MNLEDEKKVTENAAFSLFSFVCHIDRLKMSDSNAYCSVSSCEGSYVASTRVTDASIEDAFVDTIFLSDNLNHAEQILLDEIERDFLKFTVTVQESYDRMKKVQIDFILYIKSMEFLN